MLAHRAILLTGAGGVVGAALLPRLSRHRVICLAHRNPPAAAESVTGDLTRPGLGLDADTRRDLARAVDTVVHCAAATDFTTAATATRELNVGGTGQLLEFAADAGAAVHYVSSAFVARSDSIRTQVHDAAADPQPYLESKQDAEQLVRESGVPGTILRPSVVIGDAATGVTARFQSLYVLAASIVRNTLPLLPLRPDDTVDLVPRDALAEAVAAVVEHDVRGEYWITAGQAAPTARRVVELTVDASTRAGLDVRAPRLVDPEMVDRLLRPAFLEYLPPATRRRFDDLLAMTALVAGAAAFPATLAELPGCAPIEASALESAYSRSIGYFIRTMGWAASRGSAA
ncbi:SDR family oxidoreductase [Amycolatopsis pithecellobii]|uniref:NAD-dependent epimerase/dehydratase family protein n=1 Tax=Amycolatopsis pithecellobii TaxID=664692 RepID=A0A6N7Z1M5_9PSEU|nr:SDR family oxidoreductase [Amycolatopsis pithecellobii]MTD53771.1 NAD-dependent epimerase/dehydratase family protein [Amycolatopsis pithecellobii]